MSNISFDIPNTPQNQAAFEELRRLSENEPATIYADYDDSGETKPICNVERHPDCPVEIYNAFLKSLLQ